MNKTQILVIGADQTGLQHSVTLINRNAEWDGVSAYGCEHAVEKFHQRDFQVVVFTSALQDEKIKLRKIFTLQNPGVAIIESSGDDLLINEITAAVEKRRKEGKPSFSFVDDALKNAMLPITVQ